MAALPGYRSAERLAEIAAAETPLRHRLAPMPPPLKGRLETTQNPRAPLEGKKAREARLIEEFLNYRLWPGVLGAKPRRILHPALLERCDRSAFREGLRKSQRPLRLARPFGKKPFSRDFGLPKSREILYDRIRASPHNCVCGLRPIICPIRAVIKGGNTYSIPAL